MDRTVALGKALRGVVATVSIPLAPGPSVPAALAGELSQHILSRSTQLSGGERQRVAIARALMMKPRLLLCEEITSALDPPVFAEVLEVLRRLKAEEGIAIVLVTHDMSFASRAADRLVFFQDGEITINTTPEIAFTQSDNKELNKFIEAVGF